MEDQGFHKVFNANVQDFEGLALEVFHHQYAHNSLYRSYCDALDRHPKSIHEIPFLPIRFFKSHEIRSGHFNAPIIFESSGTTGSINSRHHVKDPGIYRQSFLQAFELFYGPVQGLCVIGLLPSYLERSQSSLVYMVNELVKLSDHPDSGFYLYDHARLAEVVQELESKSQRVVLIGVTFALLDFAEQFSFPLKHTIIMETGGMKGRRENMVRQEVHAILKTAFQLPLIHSEYGMTELLSQAYSSGNGIFNTPPWMRVMLRDEEDPLTIKPTPATGSVTGAINIIDLANIHSCSFIATDDLGRLHSNQSFEVLGRIDNSDLRGCGLMVL